MTPLTPVTPLALRSPISVTGSQTTLVNGDDNRISDHHQDTSSSASLVLDKLQQLLEPDELAETLGNIPNIVVIGMESAGKSSVLSALTNAPLHVAGRTATRGPMRIASTKTIDKVFEASLSIEAHRSDGSIKRYAFTKQPLHQWTHLRDAIRLAGDEARRLEVEGSARTYESLLQSSDAHMATVHPRDWPEYTMNTIVMNISGPDQQDLHMVDLPGIGQKSTSDAVTNLIQHYASKRENVIVHCMAASGSAPTTDKCVELNIQADPTGERSMVVMTKVDRIEDMEDNTFIDIITRQADRFGGWFPKLGIHPVRLAGPSEIKAGLVQSQVRGIEQQLFQSPEWIKISQAAGHNFGIHVTRKIVLDLHQERISKWKVNVRLWCLLISRLRTIPALVREKKTSTARDKALLPTLPDDPIISLHHDVIHQFASHLRQDLTNYSSSSTFTKLAELQKKLIQDFCQTLPAGIPLFRKDKERITSLRTEQGRPMSHIDEENSLWIDDIIKLRNEHKSPRNGRCDDAAILAHMVKTTTKACQSLVDDHIKNVWSLIKHSVEQLASSRIGMAGMIIQAMSSLQDSTILQTTAFAKSVLEVASSDPASTAVHGWRLSSKFPEENFERVYHPKPVHNGRNPAPSPEIPAGISEDDIKMALGLQSEIDIHIGLSINRISTIIGQKVQVDILAMLDQVEGKLRTAFQLDMVQDPVRKRSRGLFETRGDREKRAKLLEKERSLTEIETIVSQAVLNA